MPLSLLQLTYIAAAAILGALLPRIQVGSVPADKVSQMLFAIAAGVLPLLGIVYSLLFLVVQWGHSMFTPRPNLFRDHPVVWHAFGFFTAVFVRGHRRSGWRMERLRRRWSRGSRCWRCWSPWACSASC